jgi:hypothetical protein
MEAAPQIDCSKSLIDGCRRVLHYRCDIFLWAKRT